MQKLTRYQAIRKAIQVCGRTHAAFVRRMGFSHEKVTYMVNHSEKISLEDAIKIAVKVNGVVACLELANNLDNKLYLTLSEMGKLAQEHEKSLGNRCGQRSDLKLRENFCEDKKYPNQTDRQSAGCCFCGWPRSDQAFFV